MDAFLEDATRWPSEAAIAAFAGTAHGIAVLNCSDGLIATLRAVGGRIPSRSLTPAAGPGLARGGHARRRPDRGLQPRRPELRAHLSPIGRCPERSTARNPTGD
jgi:hypothetical protein